MKDFSVQSAEKNACSGPAPYERFEMIVKKAEAIPINMPRNTEIERLATKFDGFSRENQKKVLTYLEDIEKIEKLEQEAKQKLKPVVVHEETQHSVAGDNSAKRKKRPHAQDTVRRNYTLSEKMAKAIQEASQSQGITASLFIEEVMKHQPEVIKSLQVK